MRLNSIKLAGFKSFAEPAVFQLPGQLVGVVGPNGCGKSNIMDAVRWVLGESRASELRGGTMQDVIFNGSTHRKAASRASVELVFSNEARRAGGQWNQFSEIAVKRVLTSDGSASYYINGQVVRKRDVQEVFMGTGLGPRAYAIIGQGTISRIIESRPEELRLFLEEAAGVSKYKERRRESENRLHDTKENLTRVHDILRELNGQLEKLEQQAAVATQYQALQSHVQTRQHQLWYAKWMESQHSLQRVQAEGTLAVNALEARQKDVAAVQNELEQVRQSHYASADAVSLAQGKLYEASTEVGRLEAEIRFIGEGRARAQSRLQQLSDMAERLRSKVESLHSEHAARLQDIEPAKARYAQLQEQDAQLSEQAPDLEEALVQARAHSQSKHKDVLQLQQQLQALSTEQRLGAEQLRLLQERQDKLRQDKSKLQAPDTQELETLRAQCSHIREQIEEQAQQSQELQAQLPPAQEQAQQAQESSRAQQSELGQHRARLEALQALQDKVQAQSKLHAWLQTQGLAHLTPLWRDLQIEAGWETALEAALRERLHALPVSKLEAVAAFAQDAENGKVGKLAFYSLQDAGVMSDSHQGLLEGADEALAAQALWHRLRFTPAQQGQGVPQLLRSWLQGYYAAEDVKHALRERGKLAPGEKWISPQGHTVSLMGVDFYAPDDAQAGMLARAQEIEAMQLVQAQLEARAQQSAQQETEARRVLVAIEAQAAELAKRLQAEQVRSHELEMKLQALEQQHKHYEERQQAIEQNSEQLQEEISKWGDRLALLSAQFETLDQELAVEQERHAALQELETAAARQLQTLQAQVATVARASQEAHFVLRGLEAKTQEIQRGLDDAQQQLEDLAQQDERTQAELLSLSGSSAQLGLQTALDVKLACEAALAQARSHYDGLTASLRTSDEKRMKLERELEPLRNKITEFQLKEQAARIAMEQYRQYLWDAGFEGDAALDNLAQLAHQEGYVTAQGQSKGLGALQQDIDRTQQQITALGAVNLAALEELGTSRQRKEFLDSQSLDLQQAMATLEDAIKRIDAETRDLLAGTFDAVNRHFGDMFPKLFGGGQARLVMTGEEILDAGVQVVAQPPGKKNQTIALLSGGEKALTAIALVFAIFQLNPAPFCLLDEVDAPLDDANTVRYANLVKEMSARTQFLFISHNKIAMEMAEQLIGVTMQEQGVSRIVSVDLQTANSFIE